MYDDSKENGTFYGDFMVKLVCRSISGHCLGFFMEKTWQIKLSDNLHFIFTEKFP